LRAGEISEQECQRLIARTVDEFWAVTAAQTPIVADDPDDPDDPDGSNDPDGPGQGQGSNDKGSVLVTFLWRSDKAYDTLLYVIPDDGSAPVANFMRHLVGTNIWYVGYRVEAGWSAAYCFLTSSYRKGIPDPYSADEDTAARILSRGLPDPCNPERALKLAGSELADSEYVKAVGLLTKKATVRLSKASTSLASRPPVPPAPASTAPASSVSSHELAGGQKVWVYEPRATADLADPATADPATADPVTAADPADIDPATDTATANADTGVLIILGGQSWLSAVCLDETLDKFISENKMPPLYVLCVEAAGVGVAIDNMGRRRVDIPADTERFIADGLLAWARGNFPITDDPARTIIAGQGVDATVALSMAIKRPDRFKCVILQSADLDYGRFIASLTAHRSVLRGFGARVYLEVRKQERALLPSNRDLSKILARRRIDYKYVEHNGGPGYACRRIGIADGLCWITDGWRRPAPALMAPPATVPMTALAPAPPMPTPTPALAPVPTPAPAFSTPPPASPTPTPAPALAPALALPTPPPRTPLLTAAPHPEPHRPTVHQMMRERRYGKEPRKKMPNPALTPPKTPRPEPAPRVKTTSLAPLKSQLRKIRAACKEQGASEAECQGLIDDAVSDFWDTLEKQGPLITPDPKSKRHALVTFLWRDSKARAVLLFANRITDEKDLAESLMKRLPQTDVWHITYRMETDWRASYCFVPCYGKQSVSDITGVHQVSIRKTLDKGIADPRNPLQCQNRAGNTLSVVGLKDAPPQPWLGVRKLGAKRGKVSSHCLVDGHTVWAYEPYVAGKAGQEQDMGALIMFDGDMWMCTERFYETLDNLIGAGRIPPLCALLIETDNIERRWKELAEGSGIEEFVTGDLLAWARRRFPITGDPNRIIMAGQSLGGLSALWVALKHPESVRNVIAQSASLWYGSLMERLGDEKDPLLQSLVGRVYTEVGSQEWVLLPLHRQLAGLLEKSPATYNYVEYNGGHDYACWRGGIADALCWITDGWEA
jgi:enterochelin esterase family protein